MPLSLRLPRPEPLPLRDTPITNVAHRGASHRAPENTMAAIHHAIRIGADAVEVDVRRTRDGALVLLHDTTLVRTTDVRRAHPGRAPWRVGDLDYDEIVRLDAGTWKSPRYAGEPVPMLEQAIEAVHRAGIGLVVELKTPELYPGIVSDVAAALRSEPGYLDAALLEGRLVVQSFNFAAMKEHKTHAPDIPVGLLGAPRVEHLPVLASWADQVNPHHGRVDREYVGRLHDLGLRCQAWTADRKSDMRRLLQAGVDGVITNRPARLGRILAGRPVVGAVR
ncbi:MAG TPA: glycerophosphodiester phosphodiesterase family protein [Marmoricola sp.]